VASTQASSDSQAEHRQLQAKNSAWASYAPLAHSARVFVNVWLARRARDQERNELFSLLEGHLPRPLELVNDRLVIGQSSAPGPRGDSEKNVSVARSAQVSGVDAKPLCQTFVVVAENQE
jgi:hypothetical protein